MRFCILTGFLLSIAWPQTPTAGPQFEVASIKVAAPVDRNYPLQQGGPGTTSPGQWTVTNATVRFLVNLAWDLNRFQLSGPQSIDNDRFDIVAKLPAGAGKQEFHLMLRKLLTERIGLVLHHESLLHDVYEMVVAKGGLKLKPAEPAAPDGPARSAMTFDKNGNPRLTPGLPFGTLINVRRVMHIMGRMQTTAEIANNFSSTAAADLPVLDKTGVGGLFDYDAAYSLDMGRLVPQAAAAEPEKEAAAPGESFFQAVERQLGLKLEPKKAPWDALVVDRYNKAPAEN